MADERYLIGHRHGRAVYLIAGGGASRTEQVGYRARKDDVALNSTTWNDPDGTGSTSENTPWTQPVDTNFRVRLEVEEDGGKVEVVGGQIEASRNSTTTYFNVTTSSTIVKAVTSSQFSNDDATTNLLTSSAQTQNSPFGYGCHDGVTANISLNATHMENEYVLQIVGADVTNGDTIRFRMAGIDVWTVTATATAQKTTVVERAATITGQATITAARRIEALRTASLNAQATITAAGAILSTYERAATMDAEATITAAREFFSVLERTAALGAEATVTAAAEFYSILERAATMDAEATITAVGEVSGGAVQRAATMDAEATVTATGARHSKYQVRNLVATAVSTTQIDLSWDDVAALTGEVYDIERDGSVVVYDYAGTHSPGSPYEDQGLDPDQEYTYRVAAVGGTPV